MRSAVQSSWRALRCAGFQGRCLQRRAAAVLAWGWLLAAVSALAAPEPATALDEARVHASEVSPQAWLQRVQRAAERYSYEGTVVFTAGDVMSSSRIGHYRRGT